MSTVSPQHGLKRLNSGSTTYVLKSFHQRPQFVVHVRNFIKHYTSKDNIIPRWMTKEARSKARCCCMVEGCGDVSHTTSSITYEVAREHLDLIETSQDDPTISPLTLCNSHYQHLYKEVHFPQPCVACSSQPRYGGDYTHHCPDPEKKNIFKADIGF